MIDILLDNSHDITISNNDISIVSDNDESAQSIDIRLQTFLGEWFLNTSLGTPWFQSILGRVGNVPQQSSIIRRRILQTSGVATIRDFSFNRVNRRLEISCLAVTDSGSEIPVNINQPG